MTLSLALVERLRFIDCMLEQYGFINRRIIVDYFGLSTPQASLDMQAYLEHAPGNTEYDKTAKCYIRTDGFVRVWP